MNELPGFPQHHCKLVVTRPVDLATQARQRTQPWRLYSPMNGSLGIARFVRLAFALLPVFLSGCTQVLVQWDEVETRRREAAALSKARVPKTLDSPRDSTGILLVDCRPQTRDPSDTNAWVDRAVTTVAITKSDHPNERIHGRAFSASNLTLFVNVEPGTYWIRDCRAQDGTGSVAREVTFYSKWRLAQCDVEAGRPTYFGQLTIQKERPQFTESFYEWDVSLEVSAWEKVLDSYPDSPWAPLITERIDSLTPR